MTAAKSPENAFLHQLSKSYADVAREGKSASLCNLNIRNIYLDLMNDESNNSSSTEITPPGLIPILQKCKIFQFHWKTVLQAVLILHPKTES